jgi:hypothetical protein
VESTYPLEAHRSRNEENTTTITEHNMGKGEDSLLGWVGVRGFPLGSERLHEELVPAQWKKFSSSFGAF